MEENEECMPFDLVIRNGRVINAASGLDIIADVGIRSKRIASIEPDQLILVLALVERSRCVSREEGSILMLLSTQEVLKINHL